MSEQEVPVNTTSTEETVPTAEANEAASESSEEQLEAKDESSEEGSEIEAKEEAEEEEKEEKKDDSKKKAKKEEKKLDKKLKKLKLKIDKNEEEIEFDLNDDKFLTEQLQLAKVAQKRMAEFGTLQKEVAAFIEALKNDPASVLQDPNIGIDVKKLAAQIIEREIENSKKSPEQLEREKLEAELKKLQDERKKEQEEAKNRELEQLQQREYERYDMAISNALEKSDLPKTPYVVKKIADYMLLGLKEGIDVNPADVLTLVRDDMQKDLKEMFAVMPEEVIENMIGKDTINRIRKKNLVKAKEKPPVPVAKSVVDTGRSEKSEKKTEKMSYKSFFGV
jgi:hypothetical protein